MTDMQIPAGFGPQNLPAKHILVARRGSDSVHQTAALRFFSAHGTDLPDYPGGTVVLYPIGHEASGSLVLAGDAEQEPLFIVDEAMLLAHWPKQLL